MARASKTKHSAKKLEIDNIYFTSVRTQPKAHSLAKATAYRTLTEVLGIRLRGSRISHIYFDYRSLDRVLKITLNSA